MGQGTDALRRMWDHLVHPRRRRHGVRLILALLALVLSALPLERGRISAAEESLFSAVNGLPDWFGWFLVPVMQLGNFLAVPLIALAALFLFKRARIAFDLALSGTAAWLLARLVKATIERGRPGDLLSDVIFRGPLDTGYGYISGHTAVAAALATVIAAYVGARGNAIVIVLAVLVGIGRIFVGAHLPLDVAGGAAMGWAVGSLVHFLVLPEIMGDDDQDPPGP